MARSIVLPFRVKSLPDFPVFSVFSIAQERRHESSTGRTGESRHGQEWRDHESKEMFTEILKRADNHTRDLLHHWLHDVRKRLRKGERLPPPGPRAQLNLNIKRM